MDAHTGCSNGAPCTTTSERGAKLWISADGTRTPVKELSDRHLKNIVRMQRRRAAEAYEMTKDNLNAMLRFMDEDALGYERFHTARERLLTYTHEDFARKMFDKSHPYATYCDLTDEAIERQLLDVFGSP